MEGPPADGTRFGGRTVLVTGGGGGIGQALVARFGADGAAVAVADLDGPRAETAAAAARAAGARAVAFTADVADAGAVDRLVGDVEAALGPVEVLVNNVLSVTGDDLLRTEPESWAADLDGTLTSPYLCTRRVLPGMVDRGRGAIVNIASVNGLAYFGNDAYSAAKAGLLSLTRSVAVRFGRHGIRVNAIAPGSIRTGAWDARLALDPQVLERLARWYPLGRIGRPEDVANAAAFLASDEAAWITGTTLTVDGGLLAGNPVMAEELLVESREQG